MRWFAFVLGCVALGCGNSGSANTGGAGGSTSGPCEPKAFRSCPCDFGGNGTQTCGADATWGGCACNGLGTDGGTGSGSDAAPVCGDLTCNGTETCVNCPTDCGICATCDLAPTCTGAFSIPTSTKALDAFNNNGQTVYASGVGTGTPASQTNCTDPQLRMRIAQINIHQNGTTGGLDMFCMVEANDGQSSELILTQGYKGLQDNNPPLVILPGVGTFWGQDVGKSKLSPFNITITYQCFKIVKAGALEAALSAIAGVAGAASMVPGNPYGWAFGLGGAAAAAAQAAVAAGDGNQLHLQVQQTIDKDALLDLTNGRTWSIRQKGNDGTIFAGDWDWELQVEAWGCAGPKPGPGH